MKISPFLKSLENYNKMTILQSGMGVVFAFCSGHAQSAIFTSYKNPADTTVTDSLVLEPDSIVSSYLLSTTSENDGWHALMPEFPYQSPEAAAFQRYGEYAMNEYNGTPVITIPLHTITERDVNIPLTLSYDASGIRVSQEASWVGLGWNMMVGGSISYVTSGCRDKITRSGSWSNYLNLYWTSPDYRIFNSWPAENPSSANDVLLDITCGTGERDFYSANIMGESFLFFWNPFTKEMDVIGNLSHKYTVTSSPTVTDDRFPASINSFTVRDNIGNIYYFGSSERTHDHTSTFVAAWNLTYIETASGEIVNFDYGKECSYTYLPSLAESYTFASANETNSEVIGYGNTSMGFGHQVSFGHNNVSKRYVHTITSRHSTVNFSTEDRTDLPGSKRLRSIEVADVVTGQILRRFTFDYEYSQSSTIGGDWLGWSEEDLTQPEPRKSLRLMLQAVHEISNMDDTLTYRMEYDPTPLPLKTSYAQDLWGYYNGQENFNREQAQITTSRTLIPAPSSVSGGQPELIASFKGADRSSSESHAKAGTLTRIFYPTGGSTEIDYELNVFKRNHNALPTITDNQMIEEAATDTIGNIHPSHNSSYTVAKFNYEMPNTSYDDHVLFTVTAEEGARVSVLFTGDQLSSLQDLKTAGATVRLQKIGAQPTTILNCTITDSDDITKQLLTKTFLVTLYPGEYVFNVNLSNVTNGHVCVRGHISFDDALNAVNNLMSNDTSIRGAGLRVSAVTHHDSDGSLAERREYTYRNGLMLVPEVFGASYIRGRYFIPDVASQEHSYNINTFCVSSYSQAKPSYLSSVSKGLVGYSKVMERRIGTDGRLLRCAISEYFNREADAIGMYFYQFNISGNGNLLGKREYDENGTCLRKTENSYHDEIHTFVPCNIYQFDREIYPDASFSLGVANGIYRFYNIVYSYPKRWNVLTSATTTLYDNNLPYAESHAYTYDTLAMNISADEMVTSTSGQSQLTEYSYACNGDSSVYGTMTAAGYGGLCVSQSLSVKNGESTTPLRSKVTGFASIPVYAPESYLVRSSYLPVMESYGVSGGTPEERMRYGYDNCGNLASSIKDGHDKVAYLWSYEYGYPVAEIKGATYEEVSGWLGTSTVRQLATKANPTQSDLDTIRAALASHQVLVTTYLYYPGIGIRSMKTANGTVTNYEYDSFNRLSEVKDMHGNTVSTYEYHHKE